MSVTENVRRAKELTRAADPAPRSTVGVGVRSLPCVHLGPPTGETTPCGTCRGTVVNKRFGCAVLGSCVLTDCRTCGSYSRPAPVWTDPTAPFRLDEHNLYPGLPGKRFNPGLIAWGDGYALCWRDGWKGSNLWCCRLDARFTPTGPAVRLDISHPRSNYGREDPNLFVHDDALHVAFVGVEGRGTRVVRTNVLYARLGDGFRVEAVYAPVAPGIDPNRWEKNWQWFSHDGTLYAVYSVTPHRVLRVDKNRCSWAFDTPGVPWAGGEPRGGATPLRVGSEFWSFFHDSVHPGRGDKKTYRVGLYTFSPDPPFRVLRYVSIPVAVADRSALNDNYCHVLFPRGAVAAGDRVVLSCGVHDRYTHLVPLSAHELSQRLVHVPDPRVLPDVFPDAVADGIGAGAVP